MSNFLDVSEGGGEKAAREDTGGQTGQGQSAVLGQVWLQLGALVECEHLQEVEELRFDGVPVPQ